MHELIAPTLNFGILVALLFYFLRKPVKQLVADRQAAIKGQVQEAQAQKTEAQRRHREFNEKLRAFEVEAGQILEKAKADGEALKARIVKDAQANAERILRDAEATAQSNIQDFKDQIRRETIAKAVELAERMIREGLSSADQRRIVNEYVGEVHQP